MDPVNAVLSTVREHGDAWARTGSADTAGAAWMTGRDYTLLLAAVAKALEWADYWAVERPGESDADPEVKVRRMIGRRLRVELTRVLLDPELVGPVGEDHTIRKVRDLADEWDAEARRLDARAETVADLAGIQLMTRAQAHNDMATALRTAFSIPDPDDDHAEAHHDG